MRRLVVLLCLPLLFAGCFDKVPQFRVGDARSADGGIDLLTEDGINATALGQSTIRLAHTGHLRTHNGSLQACAATCPKTYGQPGTVFGESGVASLVDVAINQDGPDGDAFLFFYDGGMDKGQWLGWADAPARFELSSTLSVDGNVSAGGYVGSVTGFQVGNRLVRVHTAAIESIEAIAHLRGSAQFNNTNSLTIPFPSAFRVLVGEGLQTAQVSLTSRGPPIFVSQKSAEGIRVETLDGSPSNATFDFVFEAPRAGQEAFVAVE